jgi:protein SCO1/2
MRFLPVAALLLFSLAACSPPAFNGVTFDPPEPAPPLRLTDSTGTPFSLEAQKGKVVLVFFGYTHCPDICPTTLLDWKKAAAALGDRARDVRFIFVSVDPERDSPAVAQRYAARFDPSFTGLSGTPAEIETLLESWKLAAFRDGIPGDTAAVYTMSHPSQVSVVDPDGRLRLMHRAGLTPAQIAADIRALL